MNYAFRITDRLLKAIHHDLSRPHAFAYERVGHLHCRVGIQADRTVILAEEYRPVADTDYLPSDEAGAVIGPAAIRAALQHAYQRRDAVFHVHRHEHRGVPGFSRLDARENARCVPDFWKVSPAMPHGALVLSFDLAMGRVWCPTTRSSSELRDITCIGPQVRRLGGIHG
ncbi:hypothetical protein [Rhodanobacter sp. OR87]|uniref:hypothetical protein n=1 Tax=Rhodanobacter sp. OR87 TaxID=1076523 RepID=UPI0012DCAAB7|nr:hypothetical protein [Rhodanobacter sp. OR87]